MIVSWGYSYTKACVVEIICNNVTLASLSTGAQSAYAPYRLKHYLYIAFILLTR